MKLRVRHNSIRFRLGQSEARHLADRGECRETVEFPGGTKLEYVLLSASSSEFEVEFVNGSLSVYVPVSELQEWQSPDRVGMKATILLSQGKTLDVLIEKDFRCVNTDVALDQSDTFENPLANC